MNKMVLGSLALLLIAGGLLVIVTGVVVNARSQSGSSSAVDPAAAKQRPGHDEAWLTKYTLTERSGRTFPSAELNGQVSVVNFFFANCPNTCRLQNTKIKELLDEFGPRGVTFVSITCDPDNDTPERLREYADLFHAPPDRWLFLTGDSHYIRRIAAEVYGVAVGSEEGQPFHSDRLVVVDRWGKVRGAFHWNDPPQIAEMKKLLVQLLDEKSPPPEVAAPARTADDDPE